MGSARPRVIDYTYVWTGRDGSLIWMVVDERARKLLDAAPREPAVVLSDAQQLLVDLTDGDSISVTYRAMCIAARNAATMEESVEYGRLAAEAAHDPLLRREGTLSMAGSMAYVGRGPEAIDLLDEASAGASGLIAAQLLFQKGVVAQLSGDYEKAIDAYDQSNRVFKAEERREYVAQVLHNLGWIYTQTGQLQAAQDALLEAREIESALGHHMEVSGTDNNLGLLASYRGDIPEALRWMASSDLIYMEHTDATTPQHVGRSEVLMSAGLYDEAADLASQVAAGARSARRTADEAEALLVAARAALYADDPEQSGRLASRSAALFRDQDREVWALRAVAVAVEAAYNQDGASIELLSGAQHLANELEDAGLVYASALVSVLVGRIGIDLGDIEAARSALQRLTAVRTGPVELRIQKWLAAAMLRLADGDVRGADSAARAGLNLLDAYQSGLGATDLRAGIERLGDQMGRIGLNLAAASGTPRRVFHWMERTRGRALRYPPVVPDGDDAELQLLAELRRVTAELRRPDNVDDHQLMRRQRLLQEEIRASSRIRSSSDRQTNQMQVGDLLETLGGRMLIELALGADRLIAVVVDNRRFRLVELAAGADVEAALRRLRFDLRRVARLGRDPTGVRSAVADFSNLVFSALSVSSEELVLIPPGPLMAAPWAVMPHLASSTVTIAPSAEIWWRSETSDRLGTGVILAAGPDLENAESEIAALGALYRTARIFGPTDPGRAVGEALHGSSVAHTACHATFEATNPMFSALRLGDGDFNVYDLERIGRPPDVMVLSACDSGYTDMRPGAELSGLTSALLGLGTKSVVASIGLVPDSLATATLMLEFHRGLAGGLPPSRALGAAQREAISEAESYIAASSFVCVGAG